MPKIVPPCKVDGDLKKNSSLDSSKHFVRLHFGYFKITVYLLDIFVALIIAIFHSHVDFAVDKVDCGHCCIFIWCAMCLFCSAQQPCIEVLTCMPAASVKLSL